MNSWTCARFGRERLDFSLTVAGAAGQRVKPPRWWGLTLIGTPAPACRRSISTTALLGVPNTWILVVASTVSAYALAAPLGNDLHVKRHLSRRLGGPGGPKPPCRPR